MATAAAADGTIRAGIVVTGTEVLSGKVTDRNGPWVSERLAELGVEVAHILCVGDRPHDLEAALRFMAAEGMDMVVTSGGLGPTADDLTAEAVARFTGRELVLDEGMEEKIAAIIRSFARRLRFDPDALSEANRKQALVPRGAETVDPAGTAPGLVVPAEGMVVIVMPGPPGELHAMWPEAIRRRPVRSVLDRAPEFRLLSLRLFGIPEAELAKSLREIEESGPDLEPLEITTCLRGAELEIDVRYRSGDEELARQLHSGLIERHRRFVVSEAGRPTVEVLAGLLAGRKLAVAESCTGGLLAGRLTARPGASAWFAGCLVAYSDDAKRDLLGVPADLLATHGAVSPEAAEAMADGAMVRFGADVGAAVTGIAGPDGGTKEKPVGFVCFAAKASGGRGIRRDLVLPGSRDDIRDRAAIIALHLLRFVLSDEEPPL